MPIAEPESLDHCELRGGAVVDDVGRRAGQAGVGSGVGGGVGSGVGSRGVDRAGVLARSVPGSLGGVGTRHGDEGEDRQPRAE
jgi:hypothetical protein